MKQLTPCFLDRRAWDQYRRVKNTNIHKHFDIPEDAVEGKYDFIILVTDKRGTELEEKRSITIYAAENLPLDLRFDFGVDGHDVDSEFIDVMYSRRTFMALNIINPKKL